jgi:hypothetical protein
MTRLVLAGCLLALVLSVVACAKPDGSGVATVRGSVTPGPTPSVSLLDQALRYTRCMREQGIPFADPTVDETHIQMGGGFDKASVGNEALRAAEEACQQYLPILPAADRSMKTAKSREYSRCMRSKGLTDFPDPDPDGRVQVPESIRDDPRYGPADKTCTDHVRSYNPTP